MRRIKILISFGLLAGPTLYACGYRNKRSKIFPLVHASCTADKSFDVDKELLNLRNNAKEWDFNWDGRMNTEKSAATRHIILIRHGQYVYADDDKDCHLTHKGNLQTDLTGRRLLHLNLPYTKLIHSTMTRARESAQNILKYLPKDILVETSDLLREGAPFPPEPPIPHWPESPDEFITDGHRIEKAFRTYIHRADPNQKEDSYEIFVCHANVIRYFVCRALQLPPEAWLRISLDNGSITLLCLRPGGSVSLRYLGVSGFMPADVVSIS